MDQFDIELAEAAEQRSQAWRDVRAGRFTASEMWKLLTEPRSKADKEAGKWSGKALTYIKTKVAEDLTGLVQQTSEAMPIVRGIEMEEEARNFYREQFGEEITFAGFKAYTDHAGGSPDGYIGTAAIAEIKCPWNSTNQIEYLLLKKPVDLYDFKPEYYIQIQTNLLATEREIGKFIAYDPRFQTIKHKMHVLDIPADLEWHEKIRTAIAKAVEEKLKILNSLR